VSKPNLKDYEHQSIILQTLKDIGLKHFLFHTPPLLFIPSGFYLFMVLFLFIAILMRKPSSQHLLSLKILPNQQNKNLKEYFFLLDWFKEGIFFIRTSYSRLYRSLVRMKRILFRQGIFHISLKMKIIIILNF